ncbi:MAG: FkbM family methyltransferase [Bacteroidetes bacterium]|nr:FkbM family methyltransferase [Bacteroidota bacterium]
MKKAILATIDLLKILTKSGISLQVKLQVFYAVLQLKLRRKKQSDGSVFIRFFGKEFHVCNPADTQFMIKEIWLEKPYELYPKKGIGKIADVGANQGFSLFYFYQNFGDIRYTAMEPDERNFELLKENISAIPFSENNKPELLKFAAWNKNTELYFSGDNSTSTTNRNFSESGNSAIKISAIDFGKWLLENPCDLVKLDVEGAEAEVMDSVIQNNSLTCAGHWLIEFHTERFGDKVFQKVKSAFDVVGYTYEKRGIIGYFYNLKMSESVD